jgi:hypothetical protein
LKFTSNGNEVDGSVAGNLVYSGCGPTSDDSKVSIELQNATMFKVWAIQLGTW